MIASIFETIMSWKFLLSSACLFSFLIDSTLSWMREKKSEKRLSLSDFKFVAKVYTSEMDLVRESKLVLILLDSY